MATSLLSDIVEKLSTAGIQKGVDIGVSLSGTAVDIVLALFTFFLAARALKLAANANDSIAEFFADLLEKMVVIAIVFWIIGPSTGVYKQLIVDWIWGPMMGLARTAQNTSGLAPNANGLALIEQALDAFQDAMASLLFDFVGSTGPTVSTAITFFSSPINSVMNLVLPFIMVGVITVIFAVSKAIIVGSYVSGIIMFAVGAGVGPLFIAFYTNDDMRHYFWSWFRFMLISSATLLVAIIIIAVIQTALAVFIDPQAGTTMTALRALIAAPGKTIDILSVSGSLILLALFLAYVLSQTNEITNALFSGQSSGIKSGVGKLGGIAKSAPQKINNGIRGVSKFFTSKGGDSPPKTPGSPPTPKGGGTPGSGLTTIPNRPAGNNSTPAGFVPNGFTNKDPAGKQSGTALTTPKGFAPPPATSSSFSARGFIRPPIDVPFTEKSSPSGFVNPQANGGASTTPEPTISADAFLAKSDSQQNLVNGLAKSASQELNSQQKPEPRSRSTKPLGQSSPPLTITGSTLTKSTSASSTESFTRKSATTRPTPTTGSSESD